MSRRIVQAQPGDDRAAAALVRRLDDNLQAEMRMWSRLDREFLGLLTPLQVPQVWSVWCTLRCTRGGRYCMLQHSGVLLRCSPVLQSCGLRRAGLCGEVVHHT